MPLTPATTDKFQKVGLPGSATTLAAPGYTIGNASVSVGSTTNHPTDTLYTFAIDRAQTVNGVTSRIPGTYCEFEGIVSGGATIANMTLKYGTAQNYPSGSFTRVYIPVSSNRENALIDGLNVDHNGKGNHKTLTDDNNNAWLTRNQVASAVDSVQVSNAITGGAPRLDAIGSDTTIPLYLGGKGGEPAHAENPELMLTNFVASGGVVALSSGLVGTFSNIIYYINGKRYKKNSIPNKTYTASKDTYVDIDNTGTITYTEVANAATSPALAANNQRIAIVTTSGTAITFVQQYGVDNVTTNGLVNFVYNTSPNAAPIFKKTNTNTAGGVFYYRNQAGIKEFWGISAGCVASSSGPNYGIDFPASFFNQIQDINVTLMAINTNSQQSTSCWQYNNSSSGFTLWCVNTTSAQPYGFYVRGW